MVMAADDIGAEKSEKRESLTELAVSSASSGFYYAGAVLLGSAAALLAAVVGLLVLFYFIDPPRSALMVWRGLEGNPVDVSWVPLERISPNLVYSVVASEDSRFCQHNGIDWQQLDRALSRVRRKGGDVSGVRGASTISMQVVKNLFLWPGRSLPRKGLEMAITPVMELIWPKRRIMEVYLNIAEWGPGIYGAEAASRFHFGKSARRLSRYEASVLATALPSPLTRDAGQPSRAHRRLAQIIRKRSIPASRHASCVRR